MTIQLSSRALYVNGQELDASREAVAEHLKYLLFGITPKGN